MEFGDNMKNYFLLNKSVSLLNHGSYGAPAKCVVEKRFELIREQEFQPDIWLRKKVDEKYDESVAALCDFVNSDKDDLVIIDNTTTGIDCIINGMKFKKGDIILATDHTYHIVQLKLKQQTLNNEIKIVKIDLKYPINGPEDIVAAYEKVVSENKIKFAIVDHITSPSGLLFPVAEITKLLKSNDIIVLIDGAHAPGQTEIDIKKINCDFYVGNIHKWMYCAHSAALLWVAPKYHDLVRPPIVSKYYYQPFKMRFRYLGTRDTTNYFTIPCAIEFYKSIGGMEKITSYTRALLEWGAEYLSENLKTISQPVAKSVRAPNMITIRLPFKYNGSLEALVVRFFDKYNVQVVFIRAPDGDVWIRLMANVYNTKQDFIKLKDALLDFEKNPDSL